MGTLYIVSTPIGNMEDITLRAIRVLKEVSIIAAEDTRHTGRLLKRFDIQNKLISYFEHNKLSRQDEILRRLEDGDVALVSDAGTPGISDPGYELIQAVIKAGWPVIPVPGASAVLSALVVSGLPTDQYVYLGFVPRKKSDRRRFFELVRTDARTMVCYEAPHRITDCLEDMLDILGDRRIAVCRELTKLHEEVLRLTVSESLDWFRDREPRGEFTLVIRGAEPEEAICSVDPESLLRKLLADGAKSKDAIHEVSAGTGLPRRQVYDVYLRIKDSLTPLT